MEINRTLIEEETRYSRSQSQYMRWLFVFFVIADDEKGKDGEDGRRRWRARFRSADRAGKTERQGKVRFLGSIKRQESGRHISLDSQSCSGRQRERDGWMTRKG